MEQRPEAVTPTAPTEEVPMEPAGPRVTVVLPSIPVSDELRAILEQPLDPRVSRIMNGIAAEAADAQRTTDSRRIVPFPIEHAAHLEQVRNRLLEFEG